MLQRRPTRYNSILLESVEFWIESEANGTELRPHQLIVYSVAESGKSTLINNLVTSIQQICQRSDCILVVGPTGSPAFNAGGMTWHHRQCIR
jgi:ribosome biogenesis GTPase A